MRKNGCYHAGVMAGRPAQSEAPLFGQRLAALRRAQGLTQRELAAKLGIRRELIDYYERRAPNPSLDFMERAAAALGVTVAELLGQAAGPEEKRSGPTGKMQRLFEQASELPRRQQEKVVAVLEAFVAQHSHTAAE
jgi:transcriptional regulator with XRE-family HTH domain